MKAQLRIKYFPVSFFSIILGLTGFVIAWQKAEIILKSPLTISNYILVLSVIIFIILSFAYLIKILKYFSEVKEEFNNPIKINFFPTFSISLLLLSIAFLPLNILVAKYLFFSGLIIHFIFSLIIISTWIQKTNLEIKHMNPAWFIPAVGNILVPVAGLAHFFAEVLWFFFSVGLIFWLILLVIFFNRIIFHNPLPGKLLPTLFILIAPPSVGFIAYVKLTARVDEFSKILYYFALFLFILILAQIKKFFKINFYLSWWAYSFPLAALTIATTLMYHQTHIDNFKFLSFGFLILLSLLILVLLSKTVLAIFHKEICVEE